MDELPAYTPQTLHDLLPIYRPPNATPDHIHTYTLLQTSTSTQSLFSAEEDPNHTAIPHLHIKSFKTGGFMNRKPHIIISHPHPCENRPATTITTNTTNTNDHRKKSPTNTTLTTLAEARFDIHGTGTRILYLGDTNNDAGNNTSGGGNNNGIVSGQRNQYLELADSRMQILRMAVHGMPAWWQPLPGNRDVLELTNEFEDVIARFVCAPFPPSSRSGSVSESTSASASASTSVSPSTSPRIGGSETTEQSNSVSSTIAGLNHAIGTITITDPETGSSPPPTTTTTQPKPKPKSKKQKNNKQPQTQDLTIGQLHVVDALVGAAEEREEILCSAIVVVERMRRRRAILDNRYSHNKSDKKANSAFYGVVGGGGGGVRNGVGNGVGYIPQ